MVKKIILSSLVAAGMCVSAFAMTPEAVQQNIWTGSDEAVHTYIAEGNDVNAGLGEQGNLLTTAISFKNVGAVKALLNAGADPNAIVPFGDVRITPLEIAIYRGNAAIVQDLIDHGADVMKRSHGMPLYKLAEMQRKPDIANIILEKVKQIEEEKMQAEKEAAEKAAK